MVEVRNTDRGFLSVLGSELKNDVVQQGGEKIISVCVLRRKPRVGGAAECEKQGVWSSLVLFPQTPQTASPPPVQTFYGIRVGNDSRQSDNRPVFRDLSKPAPPPHKRRSRHFSLKDSGDAARPTTETSLSPTGGRMGAWGLRIGDSLRLAEKIIIFIFMDEVSRLQLPASGDKLNMGNIKMSSI